MSHSMNEDQHTETPRDEAAATSLERLRAQLLQRWRHFPASQAAPLDEFLEAALARAAAAKAEILTVIDPVSRPVRLRLAVLVTDAQLDTLYRQEWAELAVSERGVCYLVYRRRGGAGDYATTWSRATTLPATMLPHLPEPLATALLDGDVDDTA